MQIAPLERSACASGALNAAHHDVLAGVDVLVRVDPELAPVRRDLRKVPKDRAAATSLWLALDEARRTLTQGLTQSLSVDQSSASEQRKTRRFQRVSPIAGTGFEPVTFGL
jgi:hypothetical protein